LVEKNDLKHKWLMLSIFKHDKKMARSVTHCGTEERSCDLLCGDRLD